jgi:hypothetical protein
MLMPNPPTDTSTTPPVNHPLDEGSAVTTTRSPWPSTENSPDGRTPGPAKRYRRCSASERSHGEEHTARHAPRVSCRWSSTGSAVAMWTTTVVSLSASLDVSSGGTGGGAGGVSSTAGWPQESCARAGVAASAPTEKTPPVTRSKRKERTTMAEGPRATLVPHVQSPQGCRRTQGDPRAPTSNGNRGAFRGGDHRMLTQERSASRCLRATAAAAAATVSRRV